MRRWIFKGIIPIAFVGGFLAGLIVLGQWALDEIRDQDRYLISFSDIDCVPPPGWERSTFLDEVQYEGNMPKTLSLLEHDFAKRLADAFRRHPWVAKVDNVELSPPKQVHVALTFRKPVLAVRTGEILRAVDCHGVLLPKDAATERLPIYSGKASPPSGPAGTRWGDAGVEAMARSLRAE